MVGTSAQELIGGRPVRTSQVVVLGGFVLALFALYMVVGVVIAVTSGNAHARLFWPTVILMLLVAGWWLGVHAGCCGRVVAGE